MSESIVSSFDHAAPLYAVRPADGARAVGVVGGEMPDVAAPATTHVEYDLLPYPSMPIEYTQPAHLAALGTLFGLTPQAAERAQVLELGCAAGGNIIPLAARFPGARFLGIDLSQRHIDDGQRRIAELALHNVELRQADLAVLDLGGMQFDYIICHGVFSWIPKAAQEAVFRLCREALAHNGMATISYNVLPGWHLRTAIRDLCMRYAGKDDPPQHRVARARAALEQLAAASDPAEPYGLLMQTEARRLKGVPAAYILGEFLAPDNAPCYVQDFAERAAGYNLDYLCEADLFAAVPHTLEASLHSRVTSFTRTDRLAAEQDIDFLTGRLFRRSVLVRSRPLGNRPPIPHPDQLHDLHLSSPLHADTSNSSAEAAIFVDDRGRPVTVRDPAVAKAINRLVGAYPATLRLKDLIDEIDPAGGDKIAKRVCRAVFAMVMSGRAHISALPLEVGNDGQAHPAAWPFARMEAISGQAWITSQRHTGGPALPILRLLLPCLDGTRDHAALRDVLVSALMAGTLSMPGEPTGKTLPSADSVAEIADQYLGRTLAYLSRQALLAADAQT
jgi:hypothetical protein